MDPEKEHMKALQRPKTEPLARQFPGCRCSSGQEPEWFCRYCRQSFCAQCVGFREVRGERLAECPNCKRELTELGREKRKEAPPPAFLPRLLLAPFYPFREGARLGFAASIALFMAVCGVALGLSKFFPQLATTVSIFFLILASAFFWLYVVQIVEDTAFERRTHAWPEFNNFFESLIKPLVSLATVLLGCFSPAVIYVLAGRPDLTSWAEDAILTGLLTLGIVLAPMAVLSTTLFRTPVALRPLFLLRSIFTVPLRHASACVLPAGLFWLVVKRIAYVSAVPRFRDLPWYIAAGVYLLMVEAHVIGLIYQTGRKRLGWFEKAPVPDSVRRFSGGDSDGNV